MVIHLLGGAPAQSQPGSRGTTPRWRGNREELRYLTLEALLDPPREGGGKKDERPGREDGRGELALAALATILRQRPCPLLPGTIIRLQWVSRELRLEVCERISDLWTEMAWLVGEPVPIVRPNHLDDHSPQEQPGDAGQEGSSVWAAPRLDARRLVLRRLRMGRCESGYKFATWRCTQCLCCTDYNSAIPASESTCRVVRQFPRRGRTARELAKTLGLLPFLMKRLGKSDPRRALHLAILTRNWPLGADDRTKEGAADLLLRVPAEFYSQAFTFQGISTSFAELVFERAHTFFQGKEDESTDVIVAFQRRISLLADCEAIARVRTTSALTLPLPRSKSWSSQNAPRKVHLESMVLDELFSDLRGRPHLVIDQLVIWPQGVWTDIFSGFPPAEFIVAPSTAPLVALFREWLPYGARWVGNSFKLIATAFENNDTSVLTRAKAACQVISEFRTPLADDAQTGCLRFADLAKGTGSCIPAAPPLLEVFLGEIDSSPATIDDVRLLDVRAREKRKQFLFERFPELEQSEDLIPLECIPWLAFLDGWSVLLAELGHNLRLALRVVRELRELHIPDHPGLVAPVERVRVLLCWLKASRVAHATTGFVVDRNTVLGMASAQNSPSQQEQTRRGPASRAGNQRGGQSIGTVGKKLCGV
jgi:hypothetical protein